MLNNKRTRTRKVSNNNNKSFLSKLYDILNDINYNEIISWNIEGTGIIIKDTIAFCQTVLPKYYNHQKYSSFVRQLNLYGFHKIQGIIKEGEGFEHENFTKNNTKEQIIQIIIKNKKKCFNINRESPSTSTNDILSNNNENNLLHLIINKIENNAKTIEELKKEMIEIKMINQNLTKKTQLLENIVNGHNIFIQKILKFKETKNKINNNKNLSKSRNIKELFKKYLYYLKIYSPFITIKKNNMNEENKKKESIKKDNIKYNNIKDLLININSNTENFEDCSSFEPSIKIGNFEFNLINNSSF